jgi:formamidopyrimidine-DNA glycosylase
MPELPEVETIRRGLLSSLIGEEVDAVKVLRADSIGHPTPALFAKHLPGHKFVDIERRGKYLICKLSGDAALIVHLRMSGRLLLVKRKALPGKFLRVWIGLKSGRALHFEDMRVFGRLWLKGKAEALDEAVPGLAELGVEPLDGLTGAALLKLFKNKSQAIKSALLDQRLIAGIGNIYADESLFRAGIHPQLAAGRLSKAQSERLAKEICVVLSRAIELRGSSLRDYTDSEGVNGNYQLKALVYGRDGEPCRNCKSTIKRVKIGGRSSHFCPECQVKRGG